MRPYRVLAPVAAAALALTVASCASDAGPASGTSSPTSSSAASEQSAAFPVTITHAFGETTVEQKPERVATVAWANHEVPLALGVVPVGMDKATWGDDDGDGVLPWVEDKLTELGAQTPALFDATDSLPFEQIADTKPDVILAAYSGITKEDYEQLSKIAPTVAYPDVAWGTTLSELIGMDAEAIGLKSEGEKLDADLQATIADALAAHPDLKGKNVLFAFFDEKDMSQVGYYTTHDPRAGFLADAGLGVPKIVADDADASDSFFTQVSAEQPELFDDVDLIVTYGADDDAANAKTLAALQADPLLSRIPAIKDGHVAFLGNGPLAAAANPSPLSIPWGIEDYFEVLDRAAK